MAIIYLVHSFTNTVFISQLISSAQHSSHVRHAFSAIQTKSTIYLYWINAKIWQFMTIIGVKTFRDSGRDHSPDALPTVKSAFFKYCLPRSFGKWKETENFEKMCVEIAKKFSSTTQYHWLNIHADFPTRYSEAERKLLAFVFFIIDSICLLSQRFSAWLNFLKKKGGKEKNQFSWAKTRI